MGSSYDHHQPADVPTFAEQHSYEVSFLRRMKIEARRRFAARRYPGLPTTRFGWPYDPSVTKLNRGARAPDLHPRRCQALNWTTVDQCRTVAPEGQYFCHHHRKESLQTALYHERREHPRVTRYTNASRVNLRRLAEELKSDKTLTDLRDEVEMARVLTAKALDIADRAMLVYEEGEISTTAMTAVLAAAREGLTHVADMVLKFEKAMIQSPYALDAQQLEAYATEVGRVIAKNLSDDEIADKIMAEIGKIDVKVLTSRLVVNVV